MSVTSFSFEQRLEWIRAEIGKEGKIQCREVALKMGVTTMTVWRDLKRLERLGEIRRVHGGAVLAPRSGGRLAVSSELAFSFSEESVELSKYAAAHLVENCTCVAMEGSPAVAGILIHLEAPHLTILTNSVDVIRRSRPKDSVIVSGGIYNYLSGTFVGPHASQFFQTHRSDLCFVSGAAFDPVSGVMDHDSLEIDVKRAMCSSARKVILLMERSKFGKTALGCAVELQSLHLVLTNRGGSPEDLKPFEKAGIRVIEI